MNRVQSRFSPRTGHSSPPWFTTRVISLLLAWCWGVIGAASGKAIFFYFLFTGRVDQKLIYLTTG